MGRGSFFLDQRTTNDERRTEMRESLENVARNTYRSLKLAKTYLGSSLRSYRHEERFDGVKTYCMFVGYPKSGHSLLGSLLDAHPNAIIAHELDALRYLEVGFGRRQLYQLLLENSQGYARAGREWNVYSYQVPNQWQGRFERLSLIGDKKGGLSTLRLDSKPGLLRKLRETVGVEVKFVHVVRNPYDNISTMLRDGITNRNLESHERGLRYSIEDYFHRCAVVRDLKERTQDTDMFDLRHESLVEDPGLHLGRLCNFLDLEYSEQYLQDCASIVFESPTKSRYKVAWDADSIRTVRGRISEFDFLRGYSYED